MPELVAKLREARVQRGAGETVELTVIGQDGTSVGVVFTWEQARQTADFLLATAKPARFPTEGTEDGS